jgi:predicted nuclease of predicted toxin-antitoxin system
MRFVLDQSAEARIGSFLASLGHDVTRVARDYPAGLPDTDVLAIAHREQRILVTNDRDFGELVFRLHQPHAGVIYFRFPLDATAAQKIASLRRLLVTHQDRLDQFIVVTPRGVRVRRTR